MNRSLVAAAIALAGLNTVSYGSVATMLGLGLLPNGVRGEARGISNDGRVVVGQCTTDGFSFLHAVRWVYSDTSGWGPAEDLGLLPGGGTNSLALDTIDGGAFIVGSAAHPLGGGAFGDRAFSWSASSGLMTNLGVLPGQNISIARAQSADGSVVVGHCATNFGADFHAFRWTSQTGIVELPGLNGVTSPAQAARISADGSIIVGYIGTMAVRWVNGVVEPLGVLPGWSSSRATVITPDGTTIFGDSGPRMFRWTSSHGMEDLAGLTGANEYVRPVNTNADGSVVIGSMGTFPTGVALPFIWTPRTGFMSMSDYLVNAGLDFEHNGYSAITDVSGDGRSFSGIGSVGDGFNRGIVITLPPHCPADFNGDFTASVQDIFDFLAAYFSNNPLADTNNSGVITVQDIFDFLADYFLGCP